MSGKRKKECMDYFREMDTKRLMATGGGIGFEKLSNKVAKNYEGDKVAPKYQHEYGKRYSKAEAKEVGDKVAGKVYWQQQGRKMATGGNIKKYEYSPSTEEQKTWDEKKTRIYDAYVNSYNTYQDLLEERKRAIKRNDKDEVKSIDLRLKNKLHVIKYAYSELTETAFEEEFKDGGNLDNLDARISKAIYKAYGNIDDALEFKQYNTGNGISPYQLVYLAVRKGFITPEEITKELLNSAYETSSETEEDDEIGSSDTNNYVWSMLRDAGFDMSVENGRYVRVGNKMATGGNTDKMDEYIRKKREDQEKEEEGKYFAPFRAFVYSGSDQFADFKTDDFHKAVKWAKETLEQQRVYRKSSENLWAIVDEFTPIEKRNNVIYAYSEVARFGEEDMKDMKFENGGSMSGSSNGFYIVLASGSKKEYAVNSITEIPNIYFAMGTNGVDKGTPMVHHDNVLTSVFYANGTPVEAMPQYAGKDYYDFKKKMADGGNVSEDEDYYRVFRNNAGKDIAVKIVKNPIFGKFDYYVDGTLRGQFETFAQARQEVNYENFDMYKDGGNLHSSEFYAKGGGVGNINKWEKGDITIVNGEYLKRAEVVPSYKDDTMRGNYFVVFRDKNKKIIESKDNFEAYSDALRYAKENVNKEDKSNKKMARGGGIDKTSKTNIPSTDELVKLVANEREKKIKEWRRMGEKVVVGRNDGYWWTDGSDKEDEREISTNPSNRKIKQIIKEYPDVTEIHFNGTIKSSERVGFEMEIIDDFDVLLWSKEDNFFKKGFTFEFTRDNGKYKNTLIEKSETIEYKDRKDSGEFLYYKSIDKYGNVGQGRIHREVLQEDFDNGAAVVVGKMATGGGIENIETIIEKFKILIKNDYKDYDVIEYKAPATRPLTDGEYLKIKAVSDTYGGYYSGLGKLIKKYLKVEPSFVDNVQGIKTYWVYLKDIKGGIMAKGGLVVTSIKDIPNFKEENEAGRITYRGLGMGKLSDDFYKVAGENGTRIKVSGKEYYITDTEFNTFSRDSSGKMRIKFDAPFRKFAEGGKTESKNYYIVTFGFNGDEGYQVVKSKPILASNENEAEIMLKDQFESYEGTSCDIITVEKQGGKMAKGGSVENKRLTNQEVFALLSKYKYILTMPIGQEIAFMKNKDLIFTPFGKKAGYIVSYSNDKEEIRQDEINIHASADGYKRKTLIIPITTQKIKEILYVNDYMFKKLGIMATGGNLHSSEFYKDGGEIVDTPKQINIFIARYNGKKIELEAKSMFDAEKKAIEQLKVPKFKRGLLSVMNKQAYEKGDFQFN